MTMPHTSTTPSTPSTTPSESSSAATPIILDTQPERADLPLVVMPAVLRSMIAPLSAQLERLRDVARVRMYGDFTEDEDLIAERTAGATVMLNGGPHISNALLRRLHADGLKCIVFSGTGVASYIDLALARDLGMRICNAVHYGDAAVAEHTFALLFELTRRVGALGAGIKSGGWSGPYADGMQLAGRRLGIIGLGGIGGAVARIARALDMDVSAWWTGHTPVDRFMRYGVTPVDDLGALIAASDVVTVHLPLIDGVTRGIVTAGHLARLKPGALFVNTARAEVIAPGALTERLARGDVNAALDVFDKEPLPADDPLRTMPNVILTPHVAWRTDGAFADLTRQMVDATLAYLDGRDVNVIVSEHDREA